MVFSYSESFASGNHYWNVEANFYRNTSLLLVGTVFLANEKLFFPFVRYSWLWKQFFRQVEMYFLTNSSFRLVETDFLPIGKSSFLFRALLKLLKFGGGNFCLWILIFWLGELIFSLFSDTPSSERYFPSSANIFLNESSNPYGVSFFLQAETSLKLVETHFGGKDFIPASRKGFSVLWKLFSFIPRFFPANQNRYWN